ACSLREGARSKIRGFLQSLSAENPHIRSNLISAGIQAWKERKSLATDVSHAQEVEEENLRKKPPATGIEATARISFPSSHSRSFQAAPACNRLQDRATVVPVNAEQVGNRTEYFGAGHS